MSQVTHSNTRGHEGVDADNGATCINESCPAYKRGLITHIKSPNNNEMCIGGSCQRIWMSHVTCVSIPVLTTAWMEAIVPHAFPSEGPCLKCVHVCERFHDEMRPSHLVVKSLTHGS